MSWLVRVAFTALVVAFGFHAHAQSDYPSRNITIVVSIGPGTGMDTVVRLYADKLSPVLGKPIVVENNLIGAIGVGGGNMDEQCAYQALTKVLGPQPPLPAGRGTPAAGAPAGAPPADGGRGRQGGRGNQ